MLNLTGPKILADKLAPALARHQAQPYTAEWREFNQHWPNTVPIELLEHCRNHGVPVAIHEINDAPPGSYYCIGIGFFHLYLDYFEMIEKEALQRVRNGEMTVLFYYHEGDDPNRLKPWFSSLCQKHRLPVNCYRFVSGNTAADAIDGFAHFADHELLYWHRNRHTAPEAIHDGPRSRDFTVLSRTHKSWRATAMADLYNKGLLDRAYWSYNTDVSINDDLIQDNPIEIDTLGLVSTTQEFLTNGPYNYADNLNSDQHNSHDLHVARHYNDSYCNIVLETHFDADGSGGTFITEKTFKPIKHGQPFIVFAPAGTLALLKRLGYRTFDSIIDNHYDTIKDNTRRYSAVISEIARISKISKKPWFSSARGDCVHNQQVFAATKADRVNTLLTKLKRTYD